MVVIADYTHITMNKLSILPIYHLEITIVSVVGPELLVIPLI